MIITTKDKNKHPIAKQIPDLMWAVVLEGKFDEQYVPYRSFNNLKRIDLPNDSKIASLIVLLNYPNTPIANRIDFALNTLGVDKTRLFIFCAELGYLEGCIYLSNTYNQADYMLASYNFEAFRNAAGNGQHVVLEWIKSLGDENLFITMLEAANYDAVQKASEGGHLTTLKWIKNKVSHELLCTMLTTYYNQAVLSAARKGHIEVVEWMQAELGVVRFAEILTRGKFHLFRIVADNKQFEMLKWIKKQVTDAVFAEMVKACDYACLRSANYQKDFATIKWLKPFVPALHFKNIVSEEMKELLRKEETQETRNLLTIGETDIEGPDLDNVATIPNPPQAPAVQTPELTEALVLFTLHTLIGERFKTSFTPVYYPAYKESLSLLLSGEALSDDCFKILATLNFAAHDINDMMDGLVAVLGENARGFADIVRKQFEFTPDDIAKKRTHLYRFYIEPTLSIAGGKMLEYIAREEGVLGGPIVNPFAK